jgi:signal transduction histidine kinase
MFVGGIIIIGAGMIIWIKRGITIFYIKKMNERHVEELEQKLLESEAENQRLNNIIRSLESANHKFIHRLSALENSVAERNNRSDETSNNIERLKQDYENDISRIKSEKPLPSTNIRSLDDIFIYFSKVYSENNIDFNLKIDGSIPYLVENIIEQGKLEIMIGDFLQNALIAINAGDKTFRNVLAIIGVANEFYEFTVFDGGIPFELETLVRLGKERITTHADTGGSGIGFMTTFETMKEYGASLIINEKIPTEARHIKSVTVRFDGKNQYIINSYRLEDLEKTLAKHGK